MNNLITPRMIAQEIAILVSSIINPSNVTLPNEFGNLGKWAERFWYNGITVKHDYNPNDDKYHFDVNYKHINFEIIISQGSNLTMSIDDFAEYKLVPELYKKLDYFGFATWD